eukprot:CAMPEP_0177614308 /NCGR_PEP_ID=MMETSP0419_2-20121207/22611_1 /TAXON_ID=582737 /ORGANISM="Tetraselmis sp., Strain GSL018" /LENGTH=36 /DNA_ID= /DNA_START= /DNA_END= /DNA_ORIENTATION=
MPDDKPHQEWLFGEPIVLWRIPKGGDGISLPKGQTV